MKKKKKETLNSRISVRCTEKEKEKLNNRAKSKELSSRELIMQAIDDMDKKSSNEAFIACKVQNIFNAMCVTVDPVYGVHTAEDINPEIKKECEEIWKHLYGKI